MDGASLNIQKDNLEKLKELFPELFTECQLDWEKLKAAFTDDINFANERYVLNWAGKADAFKSLQIPTTATLTPVPEQSINFDTTQNIFIEGENLEVLKALQKSYYGKIKVIEIDPPYNTGSDSFIYPDKFSEKKEEYLKRIGDKDEEGYLMKEGMFHKNSKENGHYHSNWLSMMYPRLFLAKNLLQSDGVIFIHIDDNEVHNLRLLMNEIFGEENFFAQIIVRSNSRGQTYKQVAKTHEYILVYTRNFENELYELEKDEANNDLNLTDKIGNYNTRELRNRNPKFGKHNRPNLYYPIYCKPNTVDKDGFCPVNLIKDEDYSIEVNPLNSEKKESCWRWGRKRSAININSDTLLSNLIGKKKTDGTFGIYEKYRKTTYKPKSIWDDNSFLTEAGTVQLRELGLENVFDFPKPVSLIKQILNLSIQDEDIVLDFFGGSGTTAQAIFELNKEDGGNRKFLLIQLPELTAEDTGAYKAGYKTIAEISKERLRRVITKFDLKAKQLELEIQQLNLLIEDKKSEITEERNKTNGDLFQQNITTKKVDSYNKIIEGFEKSIAEKSEHIERINNLDKGFKVFKLSPSNFKIWQGNNITEDNLVQQLEVFTNPVSEGSETQNMLYELMIKAGYQLTDTVEKFPVLIDDADADKKFETHFNIVSNGELIIALDKINEIVITTIISLHPKKVITLDSLFIGNDQLKTNTVLQMKDAGIDFKTI